MFARGWRRIEFSSVTTKPNSPAITITGRLPLEKNNTGCNNHSTLSFSLQHIAIMSSMIDGYAPTPGGPRSDAPSQAPSYAPSSRSRRQGRSSSRPRAANSIMGTPAAYSDAPFPDDEIVGRGPRRQVPGADIPRVVDTTGESLSDRFQEFLEQYVLCSHLH